MTFKVFSALLLLTIISALPEDDLVTSPPGMIGSTIYSGYLDTLEPNRKLHYVFIKANVTEPDNAPLAIWLNGGPGCSSLIGMVQQIGPYIVGNSYKLGDLLKKNDYSWDKAANLLFLESPAIVGFSTDRNMTYQYTDESTAKDAFQSLKDFIFTKAPEFANRPLYVSELMIQITGQSYAGKYIPDLANLILDHNGKDGNPYINLKGLLVGNGVMNFQDNSLTKSSIDYMYDHSLIGTRMELIYKKACTVDFHSPRCRFFRYEFDIMRAYLNHYNIYETCEDKPSEAIRLLEAIGVDQVIIEGNESTIEQKVGSSLGEIPDCPSDRGAISYWNLNKYAYKVDKVNKTWSVCSRLNYAISARGSLNQYKRIYMNGAVKVWLFSGDFDDVVPFTDTEKNVDEILRWKPVGEWTPWNIGDHHAGFYQTYSKDFHKITVKGASHMVPQTKPKASYQLFYNFVNNKPVNNQIY